MAPPDMTSAGERTPLNNTRRYGSVSNPPPNSRTDHTHDNDDNDDDVFSAVRRKKQLIKTQNPSFWQDLVEFRPGSIPHSMILALSIGTVCGVAAFLYYAGLEFMLDFLWHTLPETYIVGTIPEPLHFLWIPLIGFAMAIGVGMTVRFLGEVRTCWFRSDLLR